MKIKTPLANNAKKQLKLNKLNTVGLPKGSWKEAHLHTNSHRITPMFNSKRALRKSLDKIEVFFKN